MWILVVLSFAVGVQSVRNTTFKIGAILHEDDYVTDVVALSYAIRRINMHSHEFDNFGHHISKRHVVTYATNIQTVSRLDSFKTGQIACKMIESGVTAIFGPESLGSTGIVQSMCTTLVIPHIQTNWNPEEIPLTSQPVVSVYPDPRSLSKALAKLVEATHWKTFMIIYQHDDGLIRLQDVLKMTKRYSQPITVRQLSEGPDYRTELKAIGESTINNIVLDCETDSIIDILSQAKEVGLLKDYHNIILTSLDAHTVPYGSLFDTRPNITAIRLVDPTSPEVKKAVSDWISLEQMQNGKRLQITPDSIRLKTALLYDAVHLFAATVKGLHADSPITAHRCNCENYTTKWEDGLRIAEFMKIKQMPRGLTGDMIFDAVGRRTNFTLQIVELSPVSTITGNLSAAGYVSSRSKEELQTQVIDNIQKKVFIVSSRIGEPYLRNTIPKPGEVLTGNDRYEGYSMDVIDGISKILNFTYKFEIAPDNAYGSYVKEKQEWNGLIKQLLIHKADLAICDLTITHDRRKVVDFTMPFMTLGVSIVYRKPIKQDPDLFSFTSPLSTDVWLYVATAFLAIAFLLFFIARMSPGDWENPHPCNQDPEELENIWTLKNTLWLTLGSLMTQGCDILPKGLSTRMVAGMWWIFSLIIYSSYTANLAAFLTNERMGPTIESAEDLAKQSKIKYGAVIGGSTLGFFKESNVSTYQRMWAAMESARPSVFTKSNSEGIERVSKGKGSYAFLMESTSIEYEVAKNCELRQVGGLLDTKGYGIAMPVNAPYRTEISGAVLQMQEEGQLYNLKEKWWKKMQKKRCPQENSAAAASAAELDLANVGGVFIVLLVGTGIAFLIAILEFLWNVRKIAVDEQMTLFEAFIVELKFALSICITKKATKPKLSESSSENGSETRSIAQSVLRQAGSFLHLNVFGNDITDKK
ncbi:Kainate-type ionotropic glutamate receptor subunit 1D [Carabus blaptoides fortunei]